MRMLHAVVVVMVLCLAQQGSTRLVLREEEWEELSQDTVTREAELVETYMEDTECKYVKVRTSYCILRKHSLIYSVLE